LNGQLRIQHVNSFSRLLETRLTLHDIAGAGETEDIKKPVPVTL